MKKIALASILALLSGLTQAAEHYIVPRIGFMDIQINQASLLTSAGVYAGYPVLIPNFTAEAEFVTGLSGGDYSTQTGNGSYSVTTFGMYGTYRLGLVGDLFAKARVGGLFEYVQNDGPLGFRDSSRAGLSGGLGLGYAVPGGVTVEFDAVIVEQDIIFYGLGGHFQF